MFLLKKILGLLLMPLSLVLLLGVIGMGLLWFSRWQKKGAVMLSAGMLLLLIFSYDLAADRFLRPLENDFRPLTVTGQIKNVNWVVVLGGGQYSDSTLPATMRLSPASLSRLVEGIRIYRELSGSRLLVSGGAVFGDTPEARTMALVAEDMGIPAADIIMETASRDTKDQARNIAAVVGSDRFILVTTAAHMPRSVALFRRVGLDPIPAPTDFKAQISPRLSPYSFFPDSDALEKMEDAIHEYLGILWAKLQRQM